jgi:beta-lactamase class A
MIATTPTIPNVNDVNSQIVERINPMDEKLWDRADLADHIKLIVLKYRIQKVLAENAALQVRTDVSITDIRGGDTLFKHNQNDPHFAASVNKLPVALLLLEDVRAGTVSLDQTMTWLPSDVRGGFGVYDQPGAPLTASLRDVVFDMLNHSGNTAVRVVVNGALGGAAAVNDRLAAKPQLQVTRLVPLDANRFFLGDTTSKESLWVMTQLMKQQDAPAQFMKQALATNIFTDFGVRSQLAGNDFIVLVNKIGLLDDTEGNNRHDTGIIYNTRTHKAYGFSILTTAPFNEADSSATEQADKSLADIGRVLLRFAGDKRPQAALDNQLQALRQQSAEQGKLLY